MRAWFRRATPLVALHVPAASTEAVIPVRVHTSSNRAVRFVIDVDLNHDGRFVDLGELAYAHGTFPRGESVGECACTA